MYMRLERGLWAITMSEREVDACVLAISRGLEGVPEELSEREDKLAKACLDAFKRRSDGQYDYYCEGEMTLFDVDLKHICKALGVLDDEVRPVVETIGYAHGLGPHGRWLIVKSGKIPWHDIQFEGTPFMENQFAEDTEELGIWPS